MWKQHPPKEGFCLAKCKNCLRRGRSNHFARVCTERQVNRSNKQIRALEAGPDTLESEEQDEVETSGTVYLYQVSHGNARNPTATLEVNTVPVTLHLDTQADVTVVTKKHFESLKGNSHLLPTRAVIRRFSGDGPGLALPLVGCFHVTVSRI